MEKKLNILIMGPVEMFPGCPVNPTTEAQDFFALDGHNVWCSMDPGEVEKADLTVIPGGLPDVDPANYGEKDMGSHDVTPDMDAEQFAMIKEAFRLQKPMVGICRGVQLINVFLGGTLIQDLESGKTHKYQPGAPVFHPVSNISGSRIAERFGNAMTVNTGHHQALKKVADGLRVTQFWCGAPAKAEEYRKLIEAGVFREGTSECVIEGVEHTGYPMVGFQWHPELGGELLCRDVDLRAIREYCYDLVR